VVMSTSSRSAKSRSMYRLAHRIYHLCWVPTLDHKARVLTGWTLRLFFGRETGQLTSLEHPEDDFREAISAP
jgi:NADH:ubiquinone reductase (H+-translocating)